MTASSSGHERASDLLDGDAALEQPRDQLGALVAGLALEAVEQSGRFDIEVFGHGHNVYRRRGAIVGSMPSELLHGLPPIIGDGAKSLILGNMPSVLSLGAQQYYANPRNAFWRITGEIFGFDASAPYEERVAALTTQRHCRVGCAAVVPSRWQPGLRSRAR